ncbi:hypothetical protein Taro_042372 [Colocasia esculenta]|uniref:Aminotransferase-like plant mobile domain-containing protein n=1 Tax=Colocasia esculenta TaxID=4460 RepID=A0A843WPE2_COLES|nr:hypothetical protein [Colocasia esculenta]
MAHLGGGVRWRSRREDEAAARRCCAAQGVCKADAEDGHAARAMVRLGQADGGQGLRAGFETQPKTTFSVMEGGKDIGGDSSRRKGQVERRCSRRRLEEPPVEEEVPEVAMGEEEEEGTAPVMNMEEERRKRAKAMKTGKMRARVSWTLVLAVFLAFPPFQRERVEEMGFGQIFRIERMRVNPALTQALRSRWDTEASAFAFPWGHMIPSLEDVSRITGLRVYGRAVSGYTYPCYHDLAERLLDLPVERRSSLVPRVALQESLGLYEVGKNVGESEDEYLARLARVSQRELASEPGPQADLDLRRFLVLFLGRLLFATRGDAVHCRFLPLLEDLGEVGGYACGAAFLAHQFDGLSASERQTFGPIYTSQLWGEGISHGRASCPLHAVETLAETPVIWWFGDEGQPWLAQARPYFGRSVWLHALNLVLPLNLFLTQRSLGLRQSAVEFPVPDRFRQPGRSFRGLHDTTDWRERAREQIENWERKGKGVRSDAITDDAYLQAYALKYGGKVDVIGEIASLRALLQSAVQDREAAQRQTAELRSELERVRGTGAGGASSSRSIRGSPSLMEARLAGAVLRAEEAQRHLEEQERDLELTHEHAMELQSERDRFRGEAQTTRSERDQLRIRAEAAEAQVAEMVRELATLRVQRAPGD